MTYTNTNFMDDAACISQDIRLFFKNSAREAKKICRDCPVQRECLAYILRVERPGYRHGVWGGLTPGQRQNTVAVKSIEVIKPREIMKPPKLGRIILTKVPLCEHYREHAKAIPAGLCNCEKCKIDAQILVQAIAEIQATENRQAVKEAEAKAQLAIRCICVDCLTHPLATRIPHTTRISHATRIPQHDHRPWPASQGP